MYRFNSLFQRIRRFCHQMNLIITSNIHIQRSNSIIFAQETYLIIRYNYLYIYIYTRAQSYCMYLSTSSLNVVNRCTYHTCSNIQSLMSPTFLSNHGHAPTTMHTKIKIIQKDCYQSAMPARDANLECALGPNKCKKLSSSRFSSP